MYYNHYHKFIVISYFYKIKELIVDQNVLEIESDDNIFIQNYEYNFMRNTYHEQHPEDREALKYMMIIKRRDGPILFSFLFNLFDKPTLKRLVQQIMNCKDIEDEKFIIDYKTKKHYKPWLDQLDKNFL